MKRWSDIGAAALVWGCGLVGRLPFCFLYGPLRGFLYFLLYYVARYRREVVRANLLSAFPEKTAAERLEIEREFYRHLAELFIDTIDMASISVGEMNERMDIVGLEEFQRQVQGRDWIAAMSHFGSWEYFTAFQTRTDAQVIGVYHPLANEAFDKFYRRIRSRNGTKPVSTWMLVRHIVAHRKAAEGNIAIGLIADQGTPFKVKRWLRFLHQPTSFHEGMESVALRFGMPVYFVHMHKTGKAHYQVRVETIWDGIEPVGEYTITARYADMLERQIREQPAYWLWSHRRWKRKPRPGDQIDEISEWL